MLYCKRDACVIENAVEARKGQTQWCEDRTTEDDDRFGDSRIRERFRFEQ